MFILRACMVVLVLDTLQRDSNTYINCCVYTTTNHVCQLVKVRASDIWWLPTRVLLRTSWCQVFNCIFGKLCQNNI